MKNLLIVSLILLCLISCTHNIKIKENIKNTGECPFNYYEFKYKGHDMVEFNSYNIIHSPECKKCKHIKY